MSTENTPVSEKTFIQHMDDQLERFVTLSRVSQSVRDPNVVSQREERKEGIMEIFREYVRLKDKERAEPPTAPTPGSDYPGVMIPRKLHLESVEALREEMNGIAKEALILRSDKNTAYLERNRLVALLARIFPSGITRTAIEGWNPEWHNCVYIDLPTGQASWHYHDSQHYMFASLPDYHREWDRHTTEQKYERIAYLTNFHSIKLPTITRCPEYQRKEGLHACLHKEQCWEPCGDLGKSEDHVQRASPELEEAVDKSLGIRRKVRLADKPENTSMKSGIELMRQALVEQRLSREDLNAELALNADAIRQVEGGEGEAGIPVTVNIDEKEEVGDLSRQVVGQMLNQLNDPGRMMTIAQERIEKDDDLANEPEDSDRSPYGDGSAFAPAHTSDELKLLLKEERRVLMAWKQAKEATKQRVRADRDWQAYDSPSNGRRAQETNAAEDKAFQDFRSTLESALLNVRYTSDQPRQIYRNQEVTWMKMADNGNAQVSPASTVPTPLQEQIADWVRSTFGEEVYASEEERTCRFAEEAIELVHALGFQHDSLYKVIEQVYHKPRGNVKQELGGATTTLFTLASVLGVDLLQNAQQELAVNYTNSEAIRAKRRSKNAWSNVQVADSPMHKLLLLRHIPNLTRNKEQQEVPPTPTPTIRSSNEDHTIGSPYPIS